MFLSDAFFLDCHLNGRLYFFLQSAHITGIKTSVLYVDNKPHLITLDYNMDVQEIFPEERTRYSKLSTLRPQLCG